MMAKIFRRAQRRSLYQIRRVDWKQTGPEQHLAVFNLQTGFGIVDRAIGPRIERCRGAFLGEDFNQSIGCNCVEIRKFWDEPETSEIRIDGDNESFRILIAAQLRYRTLNNGERRGYGTQQRLAV